MKYKNVCKFIPASVGADLSVSCFIYETNHEIMRRKFILTHNRMLTVCRGEGRFSFDGTSAVLASGDLIFGWKGELFTVEPENDCEYMYIDFSGSRADQLFKRFDIRSTNRIFSGFDGSIPIIKESLLRASEKTIDLASESMLLYAFSRFSENVGKKNELIYNITEITENSFNDPELSLSSIAELLGYNAKYLSHIFKKSQGTTYSEYLRALRLKYAVSLFDQGIDSVKNVAALSGFSDPLYFSSVFKKSMGISPKEYLSLKNSE